MSPVTERTPVHLPSGVSLEQVNGTEALVIDTPAARAVLHLDGAHLTSWTPAGEQEVLWLSELSEYGDGAAIRGGIPLVGPWFGPGRSGDKPVKHGWIRNHPWELTEASFDGKDVVLELALVDADPSGGGLRADARFRIGAELSVDLTLTAGAQEVEVEAALHTYLAVADVRELRIHGLQGADYLDNTQGLAEDRQEDTALELTGPTDRIYSVNSEVRIEDVAGGRSIVSCPRGTAKTVVWNPWPELAAGMADMPDDAWTSFVCVEPAVAKESAQVLRSGGALTIGVTYRVER